MEKQITDKVNTSSKSHINKVTEILNNTQIKSTDEKKIRKNILEELETQMNRTMDDWIENSLSKEFNLINTLDEKDEISNELALLLEHKVGPSYTQEEINKIETEGKERYLNKIPPGYGDDKAPDKQNTVFYNDIKYVKKYGDLIFWNQIIDHIRFLNEKKQITKIILITDDAKEDWIYEVDGKQKGVRAELRKEMLEKTGSFLHIKNTNGFLMWALKIEEDLIQDTDNTVLIEDNDDIDFSQIYVNDFPCSINIKNSIQEIVTRFIDELDFFKRELHLLKARVNQIFSYNPVNTISLINNKDSLDNVITNLANFRTTLSLCKLDLQQQLNLPDLNKKYKLKIYELDKEINILYEESKELMDYIYENKFREEINTSLK